MQRTVCIASRKSKIIGMQIVEGHLYADDLKLVYQEVLHYHPHKIEEFYRTLGFDNLRRHTDVVSFYDLETELAAVCYLPRDLLSVIGISH